jgi:aspartyl-tRNA synthetase
MQLDVEMSFADAQDVMDVVARAVDAAVVGATGRSIGEVPSITWQDSMERFGTDKPDLRFGMELIDLGGVFASTEFRAFQADAVKGICVTGMGEASRSTVDGLVDRAKSLGAQGLVWMRVRDDGGALSDAVEAQPTSLYDHIDLAFVSPQQVSEIGTTHVSPAIHSWHQQQMSKQRDSMQRLTLDQMKSGSVVQEAYLAM